MQAKDEIEEARNELFDDIKKSALEYATAEIERNKTEEKTTRFLITGITIVLIALIGGLSYLGAKVFCEQQCTIRAEYNEMADLLRSVEVTEFNAAIIDGSKSEHEEN